MAEEQKGEDVGKEEIAARGDNGQGGLVNTDFSDMNEGFTYLTILDPKTCPRQYITRCFGGGFYEGP